VLGQNDPQALAALASSRIKASKEVLAEALQGRIRDHHRFMIRSHLRLIDAIQSEVEAIDLKIGELLQPFRAAVDLLTSIPGVSEIVAHTILAEIGDDMSRFPTAGHLLSWAGLCPRNDESAGKRRSTRLRAGAPWLKTVLVQAGWAAFRPGTLRMCEGIPQDQLEVALEHVPDRPPVDTGCLHRDVSATALREPFAQEHEIRGPCAELANLLPDAAALDEADACNDDVLVDIEPSAARVKDLHVGSSPGKERRRPWGSRLRSLESVLRADALATVRCAREAPGPT